MATSLVFIYLERNLCVSCRKFHQILWEYFLKGSGGLVQDIYFAKDQLFPEKIKIFSKYLALTLTLSRYYHCDFDEVLLT